MINFKSKMVAVTKCCIILNVSLLGTEHNPPRIMKSIILRDVIIQNVPQVRATMLRACSVHVSRPGATRRMFNFPRLEAKPHTATDGNNSILISLLVVYLLDFNMLYSNDGLGLIPR